MNLAVEGFIHKLNSGDSLSDVETLLFATLLQTVDDRTLQGSIRERMTSWERRLDELQRHLETQQGISTAMGQKRPAQRGPPNFNPLERGNST